MYEEKGSSTPFRRMASCEASSVKVSAKDVRPNRQDVMGELPICIRPDVITGGRKPSVNHSRLAEVLKPCLALLKSRQLTINNISSDNPSSEALESHPLNNERHTPPCLMKLNPRQGEIGEKELGSTKGRTKLHTT